MMMYLESIKTEYRRYKMIAEGAIQQVNDSDLTKRLEPEGNSISIIMGHISGNLLSRFTDFQSSDGEKAWRNRDQEFVEKGLNRIELLRLWEDAWTILFGVLEMLSENDLDRQIQIRGQALSVTEALNRSLAHLAYHVGQIVLLARSVTEKHWQYLSIPKGTSAEYNENPALEKEPKSHTSMPPCDPKRMNGARIREASIHDIPQMLALWRKFWPPQPYEQNLRRKIETENGLVLVAESDGVVVGTIIGGFDGWWAWIYRVAVNPEHQNRGIAGCLFLEIHKRLADRGADAACLFTDPTNENMCRFLNELGYRSRDDKRFSFIFPPQ